MIKKIVFSGLILLYMNLSYSDVTTIPAVNVRKTKKLLSTKNESIYSTSLSREEIKNSPVTSLPELLQQEQSTARLTNNSVDSSQTAISIRGFGDNAAANSLILVDGFPFVNPSLLAPNLNNLQLLDIEHLDIWQGSQGTLWGDQAVGGVVNIITRHPKKFFVESIVGLGNFNKVSLSAIIADQFTNGIYLKSLGTINETDNYRVHQAQRNNNLLLQAGLVYSRGTLNLKLMQTRNSIQFPGGLTEAQFKDDSRQATQFKNYSNNDTTLIQFYNKHFINDAWSLENRLSHYELTGDGVVISNYDRREWTNSFNPRLIANLEKHHLIMGYYLQQSYFHLKNKKLDQEANALQQNVYIQDSIQLTQELSLTLGARLANQTNEAFVKQSTEFLNQVFVTEQGLAYQINPELKFYIRRDGNFRFPKANETTWDVNDHTHLQTQTGTSYETGIIWNALTHKIEFNLYRLELNNEIAFNPTQTEEFMFGSFQNFKRTLRNGLSASDTWQYSDKLKFLFQVNAVDARFASGEFNGNVIPAVPAVNGLASIQYQIFPCWQAKFIALYNGSQYASENVANEGSRLPGYWINTAALQYTLPNLTTSFEVINLFNQSYSAYTLYNPLTKSNTYYPGSGRSFLLTVKLNF